MEQTYIQGKPPPYSKSLETLSHAIYRSFKCLLNSMGAGASCFTHHSFRKGGATLGLAAGLVLLRPWGPGIQMQSGAI